MENKRLGRLEHYLLNSDRFCWGLIKGNQATVFDWLKYKGFHFSKAKYSEVMKQLLHEPGITVLLEKVIMPSVKERFPTETLAVLSQHWNLGELLDLNQAKALAVKGSGTTELDLAYQWRPFLEINTEFHYVERWGQFAGIWFEEIQPYLEKEG